MVFLLSYFFGRAVRFTSGHAGCRNGYLHGQAPTAYARCHLNRAGDQRTQENILYLCFAYIYTSWTKALEFISSVLKPLERKR